MSSKVKDVPDELFGSKTLCVIYFWKPHVISRLMRIILVIFEDQGVFTTKEKLTAVKKNLPKWLLPGSLFMIYT